MAKKLTYHCPICKGSSRVTLYVTPSAPPTCNSPKHGTRVKAMVLEPSTNNNKENNK